MSSPLFLGVQLILYLATGFCHPPNFWKHTRTMDPHGRFHLSWTVEGDSITFMVEVRAKGYIGFGLSITGGMAGSDIVTGWVKDGKTFFQDRHGLGNFMPVIDEQQDWELLGGHENDTHTVLTFKRKLNTCDNPEDLEIDQRTFRLIYAFSDVDPPSPHELNYHSSNRSSRSVKLLQPMLKNVSPLLTSDLAYWDVQSPNFPIDSSTRSKYWCKILKGPVLHKKHHIVKIKPLIQPGNEQYVHHVILYECTAGWEEDLEGLLDTEGHECYHPNMPDAMGECEGIIAAWGVGGQNIRFPDDVGLPLNAFPPKYYRLEVHYDNPNLHGGIRDESGLRLYYTSELRKHDAGMFMIGAEVTPQVFVPPGRERFIVSGHLHPQCFDPVMPPEGVKIIAAVLHAHRIGRELKVRHFRSNVELPFLAENSNYDFNYQEYSFFTEEVPLLKGDQITVECTYDSTSRENVTFGGLTSSEEMCLAFILYYPRIESFGCMSVANFPLIVDLTGLEKSMGEFNFLSFKEKMTNLDWNNLNVSVIESATRYSPHNAFCIRSRSRDKHSVTEHISYPAKLKPYVKPDLCQRTQTNEMPVSTNRNSGEKL